MSKKHIPPVLRLAIGYAVAACAFQLPATVGESIELQVTPADEFLPHDGREMTVPSWRIDAAIASRVIERFNARKTPLVIDYEHQTLMKEKNGQPAPAAGWFRELEWREGQGLFARVELTARARQQVGEREYLYFSPVFTFDESGAVTSLLMGALTNSPGIDGMQPISLNEMAAAAAQLGLASHNDSQENPMDLLKKLLEALGLPADGTEDQAFEKIKALSAAPAATDADVAALCASIGATPGTAMPALIAACSALRTQVASAAPDPSKYVSVAVVETLKTDLAVLTAKHLAGEIDGLVGGALQDGKLLPAQEAWARDLGKKDLAALTAYLDTAQPIAALTQTQTKGKPPKDVKDGDAKLTPEQIAVCTSMGISQADFAKTLAAA